MKTRDKIILTLVLVVSFGLISYSLYKSFGNFIDSMENTEIKYEKTTN